MRFFLLLALIFPLGSCQSNPPERECQCILNNLWLDVFLIIDDSTSMGSAGLLEVASNVNSVFGYSQIRVGSNYPDQRGTRVSVITYNKAATIRANLSDLNSTDQLTSMVYSLKQNDSSVSNLQEQLMMMYNDENGPRNNTRTLIIIYAGDYKDVGVPTIAQLGAQLQENLVTIVTVADISRNDRQQIEHLKSLASNGDGFNINDDYVSEEVQKAMCRANCFCPRMYHQFVSSDGTHVYGTCVRFSLLESSWTNAKFFCQNLHKKSHLATEYSLEKHLFNQNYFKSLSSQPEPYKYHIGLHYVNNGYFWEQADGLPLVPLANPLFPLPTKPVSTLQCVSNLEKMDTKEMAWSNENCFNEKRPSMCEVDACDTENYCS
uniref:VWFA domain-containing protein n=1 Tax=Caenorhabditis tropicalis TaxID=1561998 RepID=A0A1I7V4B6_9PELO